MNWLKKCRCSTSVHICLEATGRYGEGVTAYLHQRGYAISVVNPARIRGYATSRLTRNKTDQVDAALIADFCRAQDSDLALWIPPDPAQRQLQALVGPLEKLDKMRQQERNRLQAGETAPSVLQRIRDHITFLDAQIEAVKAEIDQHPDLRKQRDLIASIKGVGLFTAAKLLAEIRNIADFDSPQQLVAFAGFNPRQHRSGFSVRSHSCISKVGCAAIRAGLDLSAIVAKNTNSYRRPLVQRLEQRGHGKMSIVVAVMCKLLHLVFGILQSGQPFDPHYLDKKVAVA